MKKKKSRKSQKLVTTPNFPDDIASLLAFEEIADYNDVVTDKVTESTLSRNHFGEANKKNLKKGILHSTITSKNSTLRKKRKRSVSSVNNIKKVKVPKSEDLDVTLKVTDTDKDLVQCQYKSSIEAWNSFNIHSDILRALSDNGFVSPTEIQFAGNNDEEWVNILIKKYYTTVSITKLNKNEALCLPEAIMKRKDIFGAAETGSGKTLAFGIPIVCGILENMQIANDNVINTDSNDTSKNKHRNDKLWSVIIEPTRELVIQVRNHLQDLCKYTDIQILDIVGGLSIEKQFRKLTKHPHIIVGTPGRLWQLIQSGNEYLLSGIDNVRYLVIDEADRMVEKLHFPELLCLLERINNCENHRRQTFVFSATLTLVHEPPYYLSKKHFGRKKKAMRITPGNKLQSFISLVGARNPSIVDITKENVVTSGLKEYCIECSMDEKDFYLLYLLKVHTGRKIVFSNGINSVRRLVTLLSILEIPSLPLFADMAQKQRMKNLERFQKNSDGVLLATDVAARGLDIADVEFIVHYHVPKTSEVYVHRSGRSARGKKEGTSILLCSPMEAHYYNKIKQTLSKGELSPYSVDSPHIFNAMKQRMVLARNIFDLKTKVQRITSNANWMERCAKEMDIELDDDEKPEKLNNEEEKHYKQQIKSMQRKLKFLVSQTILPYNVSPRYPTYDIKLLNNSIKSNINNNVKV